MAVDYSLPKPTPGTSRATSPTETEILTDISDTVADVGSRLDTLEADTTAGDHIADATGAHAASAVSIADAGGYYTATDVEGALQEVASGTSVLDEVSYNPGSTTILSTTSTAAGGVDVDATNLAVSFDAPASGAVVVELEAHGDSGTAGVTYVWNLRDASGLVAGTSAVVSRNNNGTRIHYEIAVTGLTPGQTYAWKWGHGLGSAATGRIICGSPYGPATMVVRPKSVSPEDWLGSWSWWTRPRAVSLADTTYVLSTGPNTENVVDIYDGASTTPTTVEVGSSGGTTDDHNNGALVIEPGRAPIVIYTRHASENVIRYRIATQPIEDGFGPFGAEQTIPTIGGTTYPQAHVVGSTIHLVFRDHTTHWSYTKSTDWGATWTTPVRFLQHPVQSHLTSVVVGSTLRFVTSAHPGNGYEAVYYGEVNLTTGAVTKSDGTVLGNLDGTSLPIAVASLETVASPAGTHDYSWAYDVSDAADPEVVWVSWDGPDLPSTATYWYSKRVAGTWTTPEDIALAGGRFSDSTQTYMGGCQFPRSSPGGRVYVSRKVGSAWEVERYDTADAGATWTITDLARSGSPLVRAWPVESRDGSTPIEAVGNLVWRFTSYSDMASRIVPVQPNAAFD